MRIVYIIHQFFPESNAGTERFLLNLASSVQRAGHYAHIVSYSFGDKSGFRKSSGMLVREYAYHGLPVTAVRHSTVPLAINVTVDDTDVVSFAADFLQHGGYDLVHLVHPMRLGPFATAARQLGIPYVVTLTDFWSICPKIFLQTSSGMLCSGPEGAEACLRWCPEIEQQAIKARLADSKRMLLGANAVTTPSHFAASLVQKEHGPISIEVVPHGLAVNHLRTNARPYAKDSTIRFGYCGGLSPHKGVHLLIQAFQSVRSGGCELLIYGAASRNEEDYEAGLRRMAAHDDRIKFRGPYRQEDVGAVLGVLDVLVLPSLCYETYSFVLHEAFGCNVPVVVPDIGVFAENVSDGINGFTFLLGDGDALARKMELVMKDPSIINELKRTLRSFVPPIVEEEAYLYEGIYSRVAGGGRLSGDTPAPSGA